MKIHHLLFKHFGLGLIFIYVLLSCQSTVEADLNILGSDYYPLEIGQFIDYQVEITDYSISESPRTQSFQLREQIGTSFIDVNGEIAYRLERFKRNLPTDSWALDSIWSVRKNRFNVVRNENNRFSIALAFPVRNGQSWDGNAPNVEDVTLFEIRNVGTRVVLNEFDFPETLTVFQTLRAPQQSINCSNINLSYGTEVFAREIGLIRKVNWQVAFTNITPCTGLENTYCSLLNEAVPSPPAPNCINFGRIYTQTIIDYGIR